jgi:hypothetical protein
VLVLLFLQVQFEFGQGTYTTLKELGAKVEFKAYPGIGHQVGL